MLLHFWTTVDPTLVRDWSPHDEPWRFRDGRSHALFELYCESRDAGLNVSIGRWAPRGSVSVFYLGEAYDWNSNKLRQRTLDQIVVNTFRSRALVAIRGDVPADNLCPIPDVEVVSSLSAVKWLEAAGVRHRIVNLPLLPQRALLARDPARFGRIQGITLKANSLNLPEWATSAEFKQRLREFELDLNVDTPADTLAPNWNNFASVDVALCIRKATRPAAMAAKPATKLINAWCAGAIPIVEAQPSYLEVVRDGVDALVAKSSSGILDALSRLVKEPELVQMLEAGVRRRAIEYSRASILSKWLKMLRGCDVSARPLLHVWSISGSLSRLAIRSLVGRAKLVAKSVLVRRL